MVKSQQEKRLQNPFIRRDLRRKISEVGVSDNQPDQEQRGEPSVKRQRFSQRCFVCPRKLDRKTFYTCKSCNRFICLNHANLTCDECSLSDE